MRVSEIRDQISTWFAEVGHAGLILPNGWFGRPNDNQQQLTWAHALRRRLLLELDEHQLLILSNPGEPRIDADGLVLGFDQLVHDRHGYGDLQPHADVFPAGRVRFVTCQVEHGSNQQS
jgi:hypothetical protein